MTESMQLNPQEEAIKENDSSTGIQDKNIK